MTCSTRRNGSWRRYTVVLRRLAAAVIPAVVFIVVHSRIARVGLGGEEIMSEQMPRLVSLPSPTIFSGYHRDVNTLISVIALPILT